MAAGAHTASSGIFMQSWPMLSLSDLADSCRLRRHSHSSFVAWPGFFCQWPFPVCGHLKMQCSNTCGGKARVVCRCGKFQNLLRTLSLSTPFWMLAPAMRLGAKLDMRGQIMPEAVSWLACAAVLVQWLLMFCFVLDCTLPYQAKSEPYNRMCVSFWPPVGCCMSTHQ